MFKEPDVTKLLSLGLLLGRKELVETADKVGGNGRVNLLRVGQVEVVHNVDKLVHGLGQTRIVLLLLRDRRDHSALVVVRRIDVKVVREGEDLLPHDRVKLSSVTLLEVGPSAPANEHSIAGKDELVVVIHNRVASVRVSGGGSELQDHGSHLEHLAVLELHIRLGLLVSDVTENRLHVRKVLLLHDSRSGNVVGVDVGVEPVLEVESKLLDHLGVSLDLLENRVDQEALLGLGVPEQVRVGRRLLVVHLAEDELAGRHFQGKIDTEEAAAILAWRLQLLLGWSGEGFEKESASIRSIQEFFGFARPWEVFWFDL